MASLAIVNLMTACDKADNEPTIVSDAPKQALLEQMGVRYDKVVARKKAKLRELEREAKRQSMPMHKRLVPVVASTSGATAGSGHPHRPLAVSTSSRAVVGTPTEMHAAQNTPVSRATARRATKT